MFAMLLADLPHDDELATLNEAQRRAVEHGLDAPGLPGPLLVVAGAGTGKTQTLAHRVAQLVAHGADPRSILLLTFSRRAAAEMSRRVGQLLARRGEARGGLARETLAWAGTFHAIGARLLREHAKQIGLDPAFTIHDREDSADLLNLVRHRLGHSTRERRFPTKHTCLAIYSRVINTEGELGAVLRADFPWCAEWEDELRALFAAYVEAKQAQAVLDYDDLLLWWAQMLTEPALAEAIGGRFAHVLVDEYQDTNRLQAAILRHLKPDGRGLVVVGDDAQAIYSFRGATVRNILDFPQQFAPPAEVVTLARNYRSTPAILAASNAVIALARERHAKELWSERPAGEAPRLVSVADEAVQAAYVVDQVLAQREEGHTLKQQAVLFRAAQHSARLEIELTRRNVPFLKFGGLKFLDAAHVKDLLALLRWVENPRDRVAGFRVLLLLPGIGPKCAARLLDAVAAAPDAALAAFVPPPAARADWAAFLPLVQALRAGEPGWPAELELLQAWYAPLLERRFDETTQRAADLAELARIATGHADRSQFLAELTLDPPDATSDEAGVPRRDEDYLTLSTIHSAKGREWHSVYLLNAVDGCLPSDLATGREDEIEEERRLLYVAMTRAREQLHILVPQRFYVNDQPARGDRHVYGGRTRFIPRNLLDRFQCQTWPPPPPEPPATPPPQAFLDLAARMRKMWG